MKHHYLIILLFLCSYFSQAQGFLGRKLIVKYDLHTSFALSNPTYKKAIGKSYENEGYSQQNFINDSDNKATVGLNKIHEIGLEYLYSRSHSVSFFAGMTRTSVNHSISFNEKLEYGYSSYDFYNPSDLRVKLYSYNFEIRETRYYKSGGIAPLGFYRTWSLGYIGNSIYDRQELENDVKKTKIYDFTAFSIGFELGKQKIYYDRYLVNIGLATKLILKKNDLVGGATLINNQDLLEESAYVRLLLQQLFTVKFGIGYLIK